MRGPVISRTLLFSPRTLPVGFSKNPRRLFSLDSTSSSRFSPLPIIVSVEASVSTNMLSWLGLSVNETGIESDTGLASDSTIVSVGRLVGSIVGFVVGPSVGFDVGFDVGSVVGSAVGVVVGLAVGSAVGATVCVAVGSSVGSFVGSAVGAMVGSDVGFEVGSAVGESRSCVAATELVLTIGLDMKSAEESVSQQLSSMTARSALQNIEGKPMWTNSFSPPQLTESFAVEKLMIGRVRNF